MNLPEGDNVKVSDARPSLLDRIFDELLRVSMRFNTPMGGSEREFNRERRNRQYIEDEINQFSSPERERPLKDWQGRTYKTFDDYLMRNKNGKLR